MGIYDPRHWCTLPNGTRKALVFDVSKYTAFLATQDKRLKQVKKRDNDTRMTFLLDELQEAERTNDANTQWRITRLLAHRNLYAKLNMRANGAPRSIITSAERLEGAQRPGHEGGYCATSHDWETFKYQQLLQRFSPENLTTTTQAEYHHDEFAY